MIGHDRGGLRCLTCDPVVRVTTYGGPGDQFVRVTDSLNADGSVSRQVVARVRVDMPHPFLMFRPAGQVRR